MTELDEEFVNFVGIPETNHSSDVQLVYYAVLKAPLLSSSKENTEDNPEVSKDEEEGNEDTKDKQQVWFKTY